MNKDIKNMGLLILLFVIYLIYKFVSYVVNTTDNTPNDSVKKQKCCCCKKKTLWDICLDGDVKTSIYDYEYYYITKGKEKC
jgi:hypothetical protein